MFGYSFDDARSVLQTAYSWYLKRKSLLSPEILESLKQQMLGLETAIQKGNLAEATSKAETLEKFTKQHYKKSFFEYIREFVVALAIALVLAVVIRQVWFEPYEIPTGSMRPTFREQDHVTVSKTPFGINIPMTTGHFLFEPSHVQRGSVVTFTSEGIDRLDEDTTFMWVIPYKKRLIKRMIGKPGDSLYFYGGKIYGVDSEGKPFDDLLTSSWMQNLEHIPYIRQSGNVNSMINGSTVFKQNQQEIGRLVTTPSRTLSGEILVDGKWIKDDPEAQKKPHQQPVAFSDFYGIDNYAMARLLTEEQVKRLDDVDVSTLGKGVLYLELRHHPSLTYPAPLQFRGMPPMLSSEKTIIPLQQNHLDALMNHMYTARIVFKDGRATRYSVEKPRFGNGSPVFPGVVDGTYEFYDGKLQTIGWGAITSGAPSDSPLYSHSPENVQMLYNLGMEVNNAFEPHGPIQEYYPSRYAYFRDGDLYLLGAPILKKDDPILEAFVANETKKETESTSSKPYIGFIDRGPPVLNGQVDVDRIRAFGLKIPEKQYYVLGDNHAMSADSRDFGFVPEDNLQGAPSLIIWPPGERWGIPEQKPYPFFSLPRLIVWGLVGIGLLIWWFVRRRYLRRPIKL